MELTLSRVLLSYGLFNSFKGLDIAHEDMQHHLSAHLQPGHIISTGIPRFDIEASAVIGIPLEPVAAPYLPILDDLRALQKLIDEQERKWKTTFSIGNEPLTAERYRQELLKSLAYMTEHGASFRVRMQYDIDKDSSDLRFDILAAKISAPYNARTIHAAPSHVRRELAARYGT